MSSSLLWRKNVIQKLTEKCPPRRSPLPYYGLTVSKLCTKLASVLPDPSAYQPLPFREIMLRKCAKLEAFFRDLIDASSPFRICRPDTFCDKTVNVLRRDKLRREKTWHVDIVMLYRRVLIKGFSCARIMSSQVRQLFLTGLKSRKCSISSNFNDTYPLEPNRMKLFFAQPTWETLENCIFWQMLFYMLKLKMLRFCFFFGTDQFP